MPLTTPKTVLALDVGGKRIGVAIASLIARLPRPYITLEHNDEFLKNLRNIIDSEEVGALVIGLPRGLSGQTTEQTRVVEAFTKDLQEQLSLPVYFQDEALTSTKAEAELEKQGKMYSRGDIDALAAAYILEDFLIEHKELEL